jgi:hypothetical protein
MSNYGPNQGAPGGPYPSYPPPPPAQVAQKRKRGCLWWLGLGTAAFVGLIVVISIVAIAASDSDDDNDASTGTTAAGDSEGPITNSGNTEHPPTEDIELSQCGPGIGNAAGGNFVGATGTITNHSSEPSTYLGSVEFVDAGGTRYAESPIASNAVAPGQTVEWSAPTLTEAREGTQCNVTEIERVAS